MVVTGWGAMSDRIKGFQAGWDHENMKMLEGHIRMIEAAAEANPDVAVVLLCGGVVELPWADKVKAILYMGLSGEAGGDAGNG